MLSLPATRGSLTLKASKHVVFLVAEVETKEARAQGNERLDSKLSQDYLPLLAHESRKDEVSLEFCQLKG
ncbi:hypothetical protein BCON_0086g00340 [Botryotinia convoluta]|uniref:Uncharacterized protein n=1 Tax=Botryotinia convoluta TaxID=54673 RepID=A0A4Z1I2Q6_9HELO|nr:hypothetical protein BCON_0086g00340 [Botryotinia convoluta]